MWIADPISFFKHSHAPFSLPLPPPSNQILRPSSWLVRQDPTTSKEQVSWTVSCLVNNAGKRQICLILLVQEVQGGNKALVLLFSLHKGYARCVYKIPNSNLHNGKSFHSVHQRYTVHFIHCAVEWSWVMPVMASFALTCEVHLLSYK